VPVWPGGICGPKPLGQGLSVSAAKQYEGPFAVILKQAAMFTLAPQSLSIAQDVQFGRVGVPCMQVCVLGSQNSPLRQRSPSC
jgi:hypothetical protein